MYKKGTIIFVENNIKGYENIPQGNSREEVKLRDQMIKDFYAGWIAENTEKKMWNDDLQDYILVKYLSITETAEKAARQYESTLAVMRLSELLTKSKKVAEVPPKKCTKNQKPFLKMYMMQLDNIKMTVGLQKSTGDKGSNEKAGWKLRLVKHNKRLKSQNNSEN